MAIKPIKWKDHTINISYAIVNKKAKYDLVVLHGWGANKELMLDAFSNSLHTFRHIYIDLPGFGNSTSALAMNSFDYAQIITNFLDAISIKKDIIMGHSFGGKIATLLQPNILVLLSSAGIKETKALKIWIKIYISKILKFFGLSYIKNFFIADDAKSLNLHMYNTFKKVVNEDFEPIFKNYKKKALIFWGNKDIATKLSSGKKIHKLIKKSQFKSLNGDHYFFLYHVENIAKIIQNTYISHKEQV